MAPVLTYRYKAKVLRVDDGDTIKVSIRLKRARGRQGVDLGCHTFIEDGFICQHTSLRFIGMNAPEHGTPAGDASTAWLKSMLTVGDVILIKTAKDKTEKYGRLLAHVRRPQDRLTLNDQSVAAGHALPWDGRGVRPT